MTLKKLGRYEVLRVLGKGAMGVVYEGRDPNLDRRVAIKTVKVENLSEEAAAEYEHRFRTEARSAARLQHPNIVSVYDSDRDADVAFLVMEYIQGDDLKHHLDRGVRYSLEQSLKIIRDLLSALDYAHKQGIVHRDIKPANLLIEPGGRVKLTDFGVARIQDSGEATRTQGSMVGTLKYMAPEQVQGQKIDSRADLFSVGVVLYQLLTDKRPFDGDNDFSIIHQIIGHHPPAPSSINPRLPGALDAVVARALAKSREERFETARDFAVALQAAIRRAEDQTVVPPVNPNKRVEPGASSRPLTRPGSSPGGGGAGTTPSSGTISSVTQELELVYWKDIKDSADAEDLEGFLDKFPAGIYADLARRRLRKLAGDPTNTVHSITAPLMHDPEATRLRDPSVPPTRPPGHGGPAAPDMRPAQWIEEEYTKTQAQASAAPAAPAAVPPAATVSAAPAAPFMAAGEAALAAALSGASPSDPSTTPLAPPAAPPVEPAPAPAAAAIAPVAAATPVAAAPAAAVAAPARARIVDDDDTTAPPPPRKKRPIAALAAVGVLALAGLVALVMGRGTTPPPEFAATPPAIASAVAIAPAPVVASPTAAVATSTAAGAATSAVAPKPVPPPPNPLLVTPAAAQVGAASAPPVKKAAPPPRPRTTVAATSPVEAPRPPPAAPAARVEPEPAQRPAPPPSAALAVANSAAMAAVDVCRDKMFITREICLKDNCSKAAARNHPLCVRYREEVRLREDSKLQSR
ncbi:serine/threonine-protein kinase [Ramlibacter sp. PS3R-8]|uniref:serine/threonine-protein kinase n=1 Tax=Ramlibacter sp. PS3R-8 TaxID=3133437 RepID=UPI00309CAD64